MSNYHTVLHVGFISSFLRNLFLHCFCLVNDVKAVFPMCSLLIQSGNLFEYKSEARETAKTHFR